MSVMFWLLSRLFEITFEERNIHNAFLPHILGVV